MKAVDLHQDLLRLTVATAGNDHRLGANEAPPAIVSMFLGDDLMAILESIEKGAPYQPGDMIRMDTGVHVLPDFRKDTADRNRTSPFAFTGNKFEFRMLGSTLSIAGPNIVLNTIVADVLSEFADRLEQAANFHAELECVMRETIAKHKRIVFNGNNYSDAWVEEAQRRGLLNLQTTVEALPRFLDDKNIALFTKHKIFAEDEIRSRCEIMIENYSKTVNIEAKTMLEMAKRDILPACIAFNKALAETISVKTAIAIDMEEDAESLLLKRVSKLTNALYRKILALEEALEASAQYADIWKKARFFGGEIKGAMDALRAVADQLETLVGADYWPYPTYSELLFGV